MSRLVLWDIDGTLLDAAGFGWRLAEKAYVQVYGVPLTATVSLAGRTDRAIFTETLVSSGRDERDLEALCLAIGALAQEHRHELLAGGGRVLPGVVDAIAALAAQPGVVQSVLSGNLRSLGLVKLDALGLRALLDMDVAAFGDDHVVRADLVTVARDLYRRRTSAEPHTVLIGDTPLDVAAARESGAAIVAVATGRYSAAELSAAGAPVVLPDLTDAERVVTAVLAA